MALTGDIAATYRGPGRVVRRLLSMGRREDRALVFLLLACLLMFVAQTPYQARLAHLDPDVPLSARLYWSALLWIFFLPLFSYLLAALTWLASRLARAGVSGYAIRLSLFWALMATSPVALLAGLVAGFIGPGPGLQLVGAVWFGLFLWFWIAGMRGAGGGMADEQG